MSCDGFDMLMADAVGGELADGDRGRFEGHLAVCAKCRDEYRSMVGAVGRMRSLPSSDRVSELLTCEAVSGDVGRMRGSRMGIAFRYAASVLVAFSAGYLFHGNAPSGSTSGAATVAHSSSDSRSTLEAALVRAHRKKPGRSGLSTVMMAMFSGE